MSDVDPIPPTDEEEEEETPQLELKKRVVFTFALPEDRLANQIAVFEADTEDGSYEQVAAFEYNYGTTELEFNELDETKWYIIRFVNSQEQTMGPPSAPVYGGTFSFASPFLAVSTTSDGAHYATIQDVYDTAGLSPMDVEPKVVSNSLRQARAVIDYRTAEMDIDRFRVFEEAIARRKYNATLRIIKECEINLALGNLYTSMSDNLIIESMRSGGAASSGGVSIGNTSVSGDSLAERSENILFLASLAQRYFDIGYRLLASLDATTVRLVGYDEYVRSPKFKYPFNGHP